MNENLSPFELACNALSDAAVTVPDLLLELPDLESLAELVGTVYDTIKVLMVVQAIVHAQVIPSMPNPFDGCDIPSGGHIKYSPGGERKMYDQERVRSGFAAGIAKYLEDDAGIAGVITTDGDRADVRRLVDQVCQVMCEATGAGTPSFNSWRSTVAKRFGVNLSDMSEMVAGTPKVWVEGRNPG